MPVIDSCMNENHWIMLHHFLAWLYISLKRRSSILNHASHNLHSHLHKSCSSSVFYRVLSCLFLCLSSSSFSSSSLFYCLFYTQGDGVKEVREEERIERNCKGRKRWRRWRGGKEGEEIEETREKIVSLRDKERNREKKKERGGEENEEIKEMGRETEG